MLCHGEVHYNEVELYKHLAVITLKSETSCFHCKRMAFKDAVDIANIEKKIHVDLSVSQ